MKHTFIVLHYNRYSGHTIRRCTECEQFEGDPNIKPCWLAWFKRINAEIGRMRHGIIVVRSNKPSN